VFVVFLLLITIGFFVFRDSILQQAIEKLRLKLSKSTIAFIYKKASFDGFSGISLTEITLVPKNADTLFSIQKMKTSINFHLLLGDATGHFEIKKMEWYNLYRKEL
jgi:hypothetical protein